MARASHRAVDMRIGSMRYRQGQGVTTVASPRGGGGGVVQSVAPVVDGSSGGSGGGNGRGSPTFQGASVLTYLWEDKGLSQARVATFACVLA
jgi:hypothetical protein